MLFLAPAARVGLIMFLAARVGLLTAMMFAATKRTTHVSPAPIARMR
jgi:hypothetical protein